MTVSPLGDSAVVIAVGGSFNPAVISRVQAVAAEIQRQSLAGGGGVGPVVSSVGGVFRPPPPGPFRGARGRLRGAGGKKSGGVLRFAARSHWGPGRFVAGPRTA